MGDAGNAHTQGRKVFDSEGVCPSLLSGMTHGNTIPYITDVKRLGNLDENSNQRYVVYDSNGISPTLQAVMGTGGGQAPYTTECRVIGGFGEKTSNNNTQYFQQRRVYSIGDICNCLSAQIPTGSYNYLEIKSPKSPSEWIWNIGGIDFEIRIRKLTPREAWRLMDFTDQDFERASEVNSNTQLYKQAGNSICKNCLCLIFKNLLGEKDG